MTLRIIFLISAINVLHGAPVDPTIIGSPSAFIGACSTTDRYGTCLYCAVYSSSQELYNHVNETHCGSHLELVSWTPFWDPDRGTVYVILSLRGGNDVWTVQGVAVNVASIGSSLFYEVRLASVNAYNRDYVPDMKIQIPLGPDPGVYQLARHSIPHNLGCQGSDHLFSVVIKNIEDLESRPMTQDVEGCPIKFERSLSQALLVTSKKPEPSSGNSLSLPIIFTLALVLLIGLALGLIIYRNTSGKRTRTFCARGSDANRVKNVAEYSVIDDVDVTDTNVDEDRASLDVSADANNQQVAPVDIHDSNLGIINQPRQPTSSYKIAEITDNMPPSHDVVEIVSPVAQPVQVVGNFLFIDIEILRRDFATTLQLMGAAEALADTAGGSHRERVSRLREGAGAELTDNITLRDGLQVENARLRLVLGETEHQRTQVEIEKARLLQSYRNRVEQMGIEINRLLQINIAQNVEYQSIFVLVNENDILIQHLSAEI